MADVGDHNKATVLLIDDGQGPAAGLAELVRRADRRVLGVYAFAQMALPLLGFAVALAVPAFLFRHRKGLQV